jgi:DNA-binding response OmpR family regulator
MRLLLITHHPQIQRFQRLLRQLGFSIDLASTGRDGSYLARTNDYDLVLTDHAVPDKAAPLLCSELRQTGKGTPVAVLASRLSAPQKVHLLNAGIDEVITTPVGIDELVAHIRALLRRPQTTYADVLTLDTLEVDVQQFSVKRSGRHIKLTLKEFSLLEYLLRNQNIVITRGQILEHVWDRNADVFSNTIETHIMNLRRKLETGKEKRLIHTVSGRGYVLGLRD